MPIMDRPPPQTLQVQSKDRTREKAVTTIAAQCRSWTGLHRRPCRCSPRTGHERRLSQQLPLNIDHGPASTADLAGAVQGPDTREGCHNNCRSISIMDRPPPQTLQVQSKDRTREKAVTTIAAQY